MRFIRPYGWPVMMILKLSWWLPILVHILLGFHLVCGMAFLAKNPEMLVVWAFKLLDSAVCELCQRAHLEPDCDGGQQQVPVK